MDKKQANHSIACTVFQCANHAQDANYCALDKISVGTHESNPTMCQCTDCQSFVLGSDQGSHGCHSCKG